MNSELVNYCNNDIEVTRLNTILQHNSIREASRQSGIPRSTLQETLKKVKARAAKKGHAPEEGLSRKVPEGFQISGTSALFDLDGNKIMEWVKTSQDKERQVELMAAAVDTFKEAMPSAEVAPRSLNKKNEDLVNVYILADYHLGMIAHELVNKDEDWDTAKAEDVLYKWFKAAIEQAPKASQCVFMELGDFLHIDNQKGTTERSGNILDYGVPLNILIRVAIRVMRRVNAMLLEKYDLVHNMIVDGNHNESGANWMQELLTVFYEDEPRITIDQNKTPYYCYEFGEVSIFAHHGHRKKPKDVEDVFIGQYREVFGRTRRSYGHLGHRHHRHVIETNNMIIEQHPTLAAKDMYAAYEGYNSDRSSNVITYHKKHGEVNRVSVSRDMI